MTGHRSDAIAGAGVAGLRGRLMEALRLITATALGLHQTEGAWFATAEPRLQFITPLADGADQIAAECAIELGYRLIAVLPFDRDHYRQELVGNGALERFDALLAHCDCVLELPGDRASSFDAYVITGRATVVGAGTASTRWRRKEWPDERTLLLCQHNPAHASRLVHPAGFWNRL